MRLRDLILDPWTPLSHKAPLARAGGNIAEAPSWVSQADQRRLTAYTILRAYERNSARHFLPSTPMSDDPTGADGIQDERREYGEAQLVVKQTVAALVGQTQQISVPGADLDVIVPDEPADDLDPAERAELLAEREQALAEQATSESAAERETYLRQWANSERLPSKLLENERNAACLGDALYLLSWDPAKGRPRLSVVDPGFYFPVLPEQTLVDDYPTRIHLAWEVPATPDRTARVHRVTYELGLIDPARTAEPTIAGRVRRLLPGGDEPLELLDGDQLDDQGRITRLYPWQAADADRSLFTCYMTEAEWSVDQLRGSIYDLSPETATYMTTVDGDGNPVVADRLDLRLDFLPLVHVPNTPASSEHYGESSLGIVLQLLDELASSDTDESAVSSTTGSPPIGVSGTSVKTNERMTMGPGEVWGLGPDGSLSTVDTSPNLTALGDRIDRLLERLSTNTRLPGSVLGRGSGADSPSGYHLLLTFGPLQAMVREMRLTRDEKYPLLLRFVQRIAMAGGALPPGEVLPAELVLGSYLPTDLETLIVRVGNLYKEGLVSLETAVRMLRDGGVPIENVLAEVRRIEARDYMRADQLADATNDQEAVRDLLGLEPLAPPAPLLPFPIPGPPAP